MDNRVEVDAEKWGFEERQGWAAALALGLEKAARVAGVVAVTFCNTLKS